MLEIEAGSLAAVKDMDLRRRLFQEIPGAEGTWHAAHKLYVDNLEAEAERGSLPEALQRARRAVEFLPPGEAQLERATATLERLKAEDAALQLPAWTEVCADAVAAPQRCTVPIKANTLHAGSQLQKQPEFIRLFHV